jgi:GH15 family glucan-1,4-alpha-glucosidase
MKESEDAMAQFSLGAGEKATFTFGGVRPQGQEPEMEHVEERFRETARFGKNWIARSKYKGRWREMVNRSALILKLLISSEHGSLAPSKSLPPKPEPITIT